MTRFSCLWIFIAIATIFFLETTELLIFYCYIKRCGGHRNWIAWLMFWNQLNLKKSVFFLPSYLRIHWCVDLSTRLYGIDCIIRYLWRNTKQWFSNSSGKWTFCTFKWISKKSDKCSSIYLNYMADRNN